MSKSAVGDELAGQRGEQVGRRHQPFEMAIFVMDEGHRHLGVAQHVQRVHRVDLVGHDRRRPHQRAQVERLARRCRRRRCRAPGRRRSACRPSLPRPAGGCAASRAACARIVAGSASTSIQSTSVRGVITSRVGRSASRTTPEMIARSLSSSTPAVVASATTRWRSSAVTWSLDSRFMPQQPEDERAGPVEQPDERRGRPATASSIGTRHRGGDRLGRAQRELLGHQLADHQRGIGGERR